AASYRTPITVVTITRSIAPIFLYACLIDCKMSWCCLCVKYCSSISRSAKREPSMKSEPSKLVSASNVFICLSPLLSHQLFELFPEPFFHFRRNFFRFFLPRFHFGQCSVPLIRVGGNFTQHWRVRVVHDKGG